MRYVTVVEPNYTTLFDFHFIDIFQRKRHKTIEISHFSFFSLFLEAKILLYNLFPFAKEI